MDSGASLPAEAPCTCHYDRPPWHQAPVLGLCEEQEWDFLGTAEPYSSLYLQENTPYSVLKKG